jgi:cytosine/adenosine deaminase-related metal-dependent hydrolase
MDQPPIGRGGVLIAGGKIVEVGDAPALSRQYPHAQVQDLGRAILLPGLVNAHVHLELSNQSPGDKPASFVDWVLGLMGNPTDAAQGVRVGVEQSLRFGVTCVGDISRQCAITRPLLSAGPLRAVSYGEVSAMAQRRGLLEERLARAAHSSDQSDYLKIGISPHAPYSIEAHGYRRCLEVAGRNHFPIATHLAETADEAEFLAGHSGPFKRLWDALGAWDDQVPRFEDGPIRYAKSLGLLDYPTALLAHVNYCDADELALLARGKASVVYCPRTHDYFGHPPHRWRTMLRAGINVAVGTDSCASSPDLNLLDDLRLLHQLAPAAPSIDLLAMATIRAARAIGMSQAVGSLSPGKCADLVAFPVIDLDDLLTSTMLPSAVWIGGVRVAG